jgi:hypothetical protein
MLSMEHSTSDTDHFYLLSGKVENDHHMVRIIVFE